MWEHRELEVLVREMRLHVAREREKFAQVRASLGTVDRTLDRHCREELR